jgi:hypothetical protein
MARTVYHTVANAANKWCPMGMGNTEQNIMCQGPACMAWRWGETHIPNPDKGLGKPNLIPSYNTHGYCGMAGHPVTEK